MLVITIYSALRPNQSVCRAVRPSVRQDCGIMAGVTLRIKTGLYRI